MIRIALAFSLVMPWLAVAEPQTSIERGRYLAYAGGCVTCHTAEVRGAEPFAGGRALESPFGIFYSPNITPDRETGIGAWTDDDFVRAFHEGQAPDNRYYFPAFPYTSYTGVSREDLLAIKAWLFSQPGVRKQNREHDLPWYLSSHLAAGVWQFINFTPARFAAELDRSEEWNRGAYLVRHLGHCGECHTPRNWLGATISDRELAGAAAADAAIKSPDITPNPTQGIGKWTEDELMFFLEIGMLPDGDFAGSEMAAVIDDNTGLLTAEDRRAIAVYLQSVPPSETTSN